jgi:hypothetical protein
VTLNNIFDRVQYTLTIQNTGFKEAATHLMESMVNALVRSDVTDDGDEESFVPVSETSEKIKRANTFQDALVESNKEVTTLAMDVASVQVPSQL